MRNHPFIRLKREETESGIEQFEGEISLLDAEIQKEPQVMRGKALKKVMERVLGHHGSDIEVWNRFS